MRIACSLVVLTLCGCLIAQTQPLFDLSGKLELVDAPSDATPVEAMLVTLHPLGGGYNIQANADRDGAFVLRRVNAGRYALELPFPGRIISFAKGSEELAPDGFTVSSSGGDTLRILVSLKTVEVSVEATGLPSAPGKRVVVLAPADSHLTLRQSCIYNALVEPRTKFRHVPPGEYRVFVVDPESVSDVAIYAPRFHDFLRNYAKAFEVSSERETKATAIYVDHETIGQAVREIGSVH
jgi:hypothetical protein